MEKSNPHKKVYLPYIITQKLIEKRKYERNKTKLPFLNHLGNQVGSLEMCCLHVEFIEHKRKHIQYREQKSCRFSEPANSAVTQNIPYYQIQFENTAVLVKSSYHISRLVRKVVEMYKYSNNSNRIAERLNNSRI